MEESDYLEGTGSLIEKFQTLPLLANLDKRYVKKIITLSKLRKYSPGETITTEGGFDSWMYMLISGKLQVLKHGNKIATIDRIGDTFGEMAVIDGRSRSATIDAIDESVCLATDVSFMNSMPQADRSAFSAIIYRLFAEIIAQRLRDTSEELSTTKEELFYLKKKEGL